MIKPTPATETELNAAGLTREVGIPEKWLACVHRTDIVGTALTSPSDVFTTIVWAPTAHRAALKAVVDREDTIGDFDVTLDNLRTGQRYYVTVRTSSRSLR